MHQYPASSLVGYVDVIWFNPDRTDPAEDRHYEATLRRADPMIAWSAKNQVRMHICNGDQPYSSALDAMRYWPETATAVAARRLAPGSCEIGAPFGLDDLLSLTLRSTPHFFSAKRDIYEGRIQSKNWLRTWPRLRRAEI